MISPLRRRSALTSSLIVATTLTLVACSSADTGNSASEGSDADAFPVTIDHKYGSTTIESRPRRVVTAGFNGLDFVLALGDTPVATRAFSGYDYRQRPWADDYPTNIPEVGEMELDFEKIAQANPDLILGTYAVMKEQNYETLSELAPTVGDLSDGNGGAAPWDVQLETIGRALGKSAEAQRVSDSVNADFSEAKQANPQFAGRTVAVAMLLDDGFYILEQGDPRNRYFNDLGFASPTQTGEVSAERLDLLDQENLVVLGATEEDLATNPLFSQLDVVREDRTVYLGDFGTDVPAALGFASPLSLPYLLEATVPALAAATDDDPATTVPAVG